METTPCENSHLCLLSKVWEKKLIYLIYFVVGNSDYFQIADIHLSVMDFVMIGSILEYAIMMGEIAVYQIQKRVTVCNVIVFKKIQLHTKIVHSQVLLEIISVMILQITECVDLIMVG